LGENYGGGSGNPPIWVPEGMWKLVYRMVGHVWQAAGVVHYIQN